MLIKEKVAHLLSVRDLAIGAGMLTVLVTVLGQGTFRPTMEEMLKGNINWPFVLYVVTLVSLVVLAVLWYAHGTDELELLENWLRPSRLKFHTKKRQYLIIFAVGIILPLMAVYSNFIAFFSMGFTCYLLIDLWSWKVRREEIGRAIQDSRRSLASYREQVAPNGRTVSAADGKILERLQVFDDAADSIGAYYLRRRHYTRLAIEAALVAAAAVMAVLLHKSDASVGHLSPVTGFVQRLANQFGDTPPAARENLRVLYYCGFLIVFWGSELVIHRWRKAMYASLDLLDEKREELGPG